MSSDRAFLALVAGYVAIVLWCLACGDSLRELVTRLRRRSRHVLPGGRRYVTGVLAGVALAGVAAGAVFGIGDVGPAGKAGREATRFPRTANPAPLRPSHGLNAPLAAADRLAPSTQGANPSTHVRRPAAKHPQVVSNLVSVSARVTRAASTTSSTQVASSAGPAPLPAPPESPPPSPLAAP